MTTGEQDKVAAERSAGVKPKEEPAPTDSRAPYAVEILDRANSVIRVWHCRLEEPPIGYAVRIRPL
jgi:hypothetical protein